MRYLLDTHIFLWWVLNNPKLSDYAKDVIADPDNDIYLSAASTWEMVIKSSVGKIILPPSPEIFIKNQICSNNIKTLDITIAHTFAVSKLPSIHKDPFDRILIAQAITESITIITDDELIKKYDVEILHEEKT